MMHKLTIAAATIAFGSLLVSVPAGADRLHGSITQDGKCWHDSVNHGGSNGHTFGYWSECPQKARAITPAGINTASCPTGQERSIRSGFCIPAHGNRG
jgi:hypothetical protein